MNTFLRSLLIGLACLTGLGQMQAATWQEWRDHAKQVAGSAFRQFAGFTGLAAVLGFANLRCQTTYWSTAEDKACYALIPAILGSGFTAAGTYIKDSWSMLNDKSQDYGSTIRAKSTNLLLGINQGLWSGLAGLAGVAIAISGPSKDDTPNMIAGGALTTAACVGLAGSYQRIKGALTPESK